MKLTNFFLCRLLESYLMKFSKFCACYTWNMTWKHYGNEYHRNLLVLMSEFSLKMNVIDEWFFCIYETISRVKLKYRLNKTIVTKIWEKWFKKQHVPNVLKIRRNNGSWSEPSHVHSDPMPNAISHYLTFLKF